MDLPGPRWLWIALFILVLIFVLNLLGIIHLHFTFGF